MLRTPLAWLFAAVAVVVAVLLGLTLIALRGVDVETGTDDGARPAEVSRCVERFLAEPHEGEASDEELARYVERAYCEPFARRGWVYPDGAFRIAAYTESRSPTAKRRRLMDPRSRCHVPRIRCSTAGSSTTFDAPKHERLSRG